MCVVNRADRGFDLLNRVAVDTAVGLIMQTDGNLVLYRHDGFPLFDTPNQWQPGSRAASRERRARRRVLTRNERAVGL